MTSLPANQKKSLAASANQMKTPNNTGALQKRSANGHLVRVTVNGDADYDNDDDDDEEEEHLSTNQGEPRSKNTPRNNEDAGSFSQSVNSVASSSKRTNHKDEIGRKARTNHSTDLKVSSNQKITQGYFASRNSSAQIGK